MRTTTHTSNEIGIEFKVWAPTFNRVTHRLYLLGSLKELGAWNIEDALRALPAPDLHIWSVQAAVPAQSRFEWVWLKINIKTKKVEWERPVKRNRTVTYFSAVLHTVWAEHEEVFLQYAANVELTTFKTVNKGHVLVLTGSSITLGAWDMQKALHACEFPKHSGYWKVSFSFDARKNLEFKWAVVKERDVNNVQEQEKVSHNLYGRHTWMRVAAPFMTTSTVVVEVLPLDHLLDNMMGRTDIIVRERKRRLIEIRQWLISSRDSGNLPRAPLLVGRNAVPNRVPIPGLRPPSKSASISTSLSSQPSMADVDLKSRSESVNNVEILTRQLNKDFLQSSDLHVFAIKGAGQEEVPTDLINIEQLGRTGIVPEGDLLVLDYPEHPPASMWSLTRGWVGSTTKTTDKEGNTGILNHDAYQEIQNDPEVFQRVDSDDTTHSTVGAIEKTTQRICKFHNKGDVLLTGDECHDLVPSNTITHSPDQMCISPFGPERLHERVQNEEISNETICVNLKENDKGSDKQRANASSSDGNFIDEKEEHFKLSRHGRSSSTENLDASPILKSRHPHQMSPNQNMFFDISHLEAVLSGRGDSKTTSVFHNEKESNQNYETKPTFEEDTKDYPCPWQIFEASTNLDKSIAYCFPGELDKINVIPDDSDFFRRLDSESQIKLQQQKTPSPRRDRRLNDSHVHGVKDDTCIPYIDDTSSSEIESRTLKDDTEINHRNDNVNYYLESECFDEQSSRSLNETNPARQSEFLPPVSISVCDTRDDDEGFSESEAVADGDEVRSLVSKSSMMSSFDVYDDTDELWGARPAYWELFQHQRSLGVEPGGHILQVEETTCSNTNAIDTVDDASSMKLESEINHTTDASSLKPLSTENTQSENGLNKKQIDHYMSVEEFSYTHSPTRAILENVQEKLATRTPYRNISPRCEFRSYNGIDVPRFCEASTLEFHVPDTVGRMQKRMKESSSKHIMVNTKENSTPEEAASLTLPKVHSGTHTILSKLEPDSLSDIPKEGTMRKSSHDVGGINLPSMKKDELSDVLHFSFAPSDSLNLKRRREIAHALETEWGRLSASSACHNASPSPPRATGSDIISEKPVFGRPPLLTSSSMEDASRAAHNSNISSPDARPPFKYKNAKTLACSPTRLQHLTHKEMNVVDRRAMARQMEKMWGESANLKP